MISREDFMFTIGYDGDTAIVDGKAKAQYGKLDTLSLARQGLFRSSFASALYSGSKEELTAFAELYNAASGTSYSTAEEFQRLFGVKREAVRKVLVL